VEGDGRDGLGDEEPLYDRGKVASVRVFRCPRNALRPSPGTSQVSGKRVSSDLLWGTIAEVFSVGPVAEEYVGEFVGQCAALAHGVAGTRNAEEDGPTRGVAHSQAMFVRARVKYGNIVACGLLDERDEIAEGLDSQAVLAAKRCRRRFALLFQCHALHALP
jgi:hypothetical protein